MTALALIIGAALFIGIGGLVVLLWVISGKQYEDLDGAAMRILIDDEEDQARPASSGHSNTA